MKKIVVASVRQKVGKTTVSLGIAKKKENVGYMKPLGDNQIYRKKRLVDYDASLFKEVFSMDEPIEDFTLGFYHSKILHTFANVEKEFKERYQKLSKEKDFFIIEGGEDIIRGSSIKLDAFSIAKKINAGIILVVAGELYDILDDITFATWIANKKGVKIEGIVVNKVREGDKEKVKKEMKKLGVPVLGFIPFIKELNVLKARYIADKLFAKVVAGEGGLDNSIKSIFIAALSVPEIVRHPEFKKEDKLIITGGDRTDVITACLRDKTSCIILTNNIIPSPNILAKADRNNIPLLLLKSDTYSVAKKVEDIEPIILPSETKKIEKITKAMKDIDI